jgi:hypothetical protein
MNAFRIFTIRHAYVEYGVVEYGPARIDAHVIDGRKVPVIAVGEEGGLASLAIDLLPGNQEKFNRGKPVEVTKVSECRTITGALKLIEVSDDTECDREAAYVVVKHFYGINGGSNNHTGDLIEEYYTLNKDGLRGCQILEIDPKERYTYQQAGGPLNRALLEAESPYWHEAKVAPARFAAFDRKIIFQPNPIEVITEGLLDNGEFRKWYNATQLIGKISRGVVFHNTHALKNQQREYDEYDRYYLWDGGERLRVFTHENRLKQPALIS